MMTIIFILLMFAVFGKLVSWAFKATWGIIKVLLMLVCLPIILIGLAVGGLVYFSIAILVVIGIVIMVSTVVGIISN